MKITKRQLRRIIKEERARILNEMWDDDDPSVAQPNADKKRKNQEEISKHLGKLHDTINVLWELMGPDELAEELRGIAEETEIEAGRHVGRSETWR